MKICLLDPGIGTQAGTLSTNLGDLLIQRATSDVLGDLFPNSDLTRYSTQQFLTRDQLQYAARCDLTFVGGTNLLTSHMLRYRQWKLSITAARTLKNVVLLGVGWWQYQGRPDLFTRFLLKSCLSKTHLHSVRDSYTLAQLRSIGITNVINTTCPTLWPLQDIDQEDIPQTKAKNVLVLLTDYARDYECDKRLLRLLNEKYQRVFLWPQGRLDAEYVAHIGEPVQVLDHSIGAFTELLRSAVPFDYVGTRLHGGIWCLRHKRRSLILEVDNRAKEIAKDTNLPTASRGDFASIRRWIDGPSDTRLALPRDSIGRWKQQFSALPNERNYKCNMSEQAV